MYGRNFMKILQCKTIQFANILTVQVFLLTENRVESVKKYSTYLNLQSTLAILNMHYLEFRSISNFFPVPSAFTICFPIKCLVISNSAIFSYLLSRTNFLVPRKNYSRYLELLRECSSQKPIHEDFFLCVRTRVFNRMLF